MADFIFNIAKGAFAEKIRDDATKIGVLILKTAEADATLKDYATVAAMLAAGGGANNVEANFTNYGRKTGITATLTVDNVNDRVDVDMPDQTWLNAGGATNNSTVKLVVFYDEGGTDATRIPLSCQDYAITTDGSDLVAQINTAGFARAS